MPKRQKVNVFDGRLDPLSWPSRRADHGANDDIEFDFRRYFLVIFCLATCEARCEAPFCATLWVVRGLHQTTTEFTRIEVIAKTAFPVSKLLILLGLRRSPAAVEI